MRRGVLHGLHVDRGRQPRERQRPSRPRLARGVRLALTVVDVVVRDVCWSMMVLGIPRHLGIRYGFCRESRVVRLRMFLSIHELVYKRQRPTVASDLWKNGYAAEGRSGPRNARIGAPVMYDMVAVGGRRKF